MRVICNDSVTRHSQCSTPITQFPISARGCPFWFLVDWLRLFLLYSGDFCVAFILYCFHRIFVRANNNQSYNDGYKSDRTNNYPPVKAGFFLLVLLSGCNGWLLVDYLVAEFIHFLQRNQAIIEQCFKLLQFLDLF